MSTVLNVFISSKMVELKPECEALFKLIPTLDYGDIKLHGWVFEEDAGASSEAIRSIYLDALRNSALYIGIFWHEYGAWTIDEFDRATEWGMERHIFVKDVEANKRDPNLTEFLNKQGDVKKGITVKWFTGENTDEQIANLCLEVKRSVDEWFEKYRSGSRGESSARIYSTANAIIERPKRLIGRDDVLETVRNLLNSGERVLLQGDSGIGKTALAAELAAQFTPLIWLHGGRNNETELFEALARPFNAQEAIAKETGVGKIHLMRSILAQSNLKLVVLDDAWNGQAFQIVIQAIPSNVALLVTSQRCYGINSVIKVEEFDLDKSLELLGYFANQDYLHDKDAIELCNKLGHLAFGLRFAGLNLMVNRWTPSQLISKLDKFYEDWTAPVDFIESGREIVAKLIWVCLHALEIKAQREFLLLSTFFAPQITAEMLYLSFIPSLDVIEARLLVMRKAYPYLKHIPDEQLKAEITQSMLNNRNRDFAKKALDTLHLRGLVECQPANSITTESYRIHDLAYRYVNAQSGEKEKVSALQVCLTYIIHHNWRSLEAFAALRSEIDNLFGAANWAFDAGQYALVEEFARNLIMESEFWDYGGYFNDAIHMLGLAVESARRQGKKRQEGEYLETLGSIYNKLGQTDKAITYYEQALELVHETGDWQGEGTILGKLGLAHAYLGREAIAIRSYERALELLHKIEDWQGVGNQLVNLGNIFFLRGDMEQAIKCFRFALYSMRKIEDEHAEGNILCELGNIYRALGEVKKACMYHEDSLAIYRQIGDCIGEGNQLINLGVVYEEDLQDYQGALRWYQKARKVFVDINSGHHVVEVDYNIECVQLKISKSTKKT